MARLREWHRQHVLSLLDAGMEMRLIRRHQLDDPRMTDEVRQVLVEAAIERRRKARFGHGPVYVQSNTALRSVLFEKH